MGKIEGGSLGESTETLKERLIDLEKSAHLYFGSHQLDKLHETIVEINACVDQLMPDATTRERIYLSGTKLFWEEKERLAKFEQQETEKKE